MSIAYGMNGDSYMAEKYKAISNLEQLRSMGKIPRSGQSYEKNCPKSS
jgi:hypothetical protein